VAKAIFLDKDGTLIPDIPYNTDPVKITLINGAGIALKRLAVENYLFVIVSNQAGIARGYIQEIDLLKIRDKIVDLFSEIHLELAGFYYCPHDVNGTVESFAVACNCRKPLPGMLQEAAEDHSIDLSSSWMIGDILDDVEAGNRAGCRTILFDNGNETEWIKGEYRIPDFKVKDLIEAADIILNPLNSTKTI
jgi:D-glycero-D-manno-heptose 1,7-bisphosphate phosphatase